MDTYLIAKADDLDEIYNYDSDNSVDLVKFTDIALTDLTNININTSVNSLYFTYGASGKLTVDSYFSGVNYQVNKFQFTGSDTLTNFIIGTVGKDTLAGTAANDAINGLGNADTMKGGAGNDLYFVNHAGDAVIEATNAGIDTVLSNMSYTLTDNVENLALLVGAVTATGNALDNTLTGNTAANILSGLLGNDTLVGNSGSDQLDGGTGADILKGGLGDDVYVIDNVGDSVTENSGEGRDTVLSSVTYTLVANIENLTLTGIAAINGIGNKLANTLVGNVAANTLNGGAGADILKGGLGNDFYVLDNAGDSVVEQLGEGTDTVQSSLTYSFWEPMLKT